MLQWRFQGEAAEAVAPVRGSEDAAPVETAEEPAMPVEPPMDVAAEVTEVHPYHTHTTDFT